MRGLSLSHGSTELLDNADLKLFQGHRYGLVGRNGVGKTTLLQQLASGKFSGFSASLRTLLVQQEASGREDVSVRQCVVQSDREREKIVQRVRQLEALLGTSSSSSSSSSSSTRSEEEEVLFHQELTELYNKLSELESGAVEAKAIQILKGLGVCNLSVPYSITPC